MTTKTAMPLQKSHERPAIQPSNALLASTLALSEPDRKTSVECLNQLLADVITLRDLYKKHHWQVSGMNFYSLHLLFDKHAGEQSELVDTIAERVQTLGGVTIAVGNDVAETTLIPRAPRERESATEQIRRLLHAHEIILNEARAMARVTANNDVGTNDVIVSDVIRLNELQSWFLSAHVLPAAQE